MRIYVIFDTKTSEFWCFRSLTSASNFIGISYQVGLRYKRLGKLVKNRFKLVEKEVPVEKNKRRRGNF